MSLKQVSKRMAAAALTAVMAAAMNVSAVEAAIDYPKTDEKVIILNNLTKNDYITKLNQQTDPIITSINNGNYDVIPIVWGPATGSPDPLEPVGDGVDLTVPMDVGNTALRDKGILDVTAAPFGAIVNDGVDDTAALQKAINYGMYYQMAVYFPSGTYHVSDTIHISSGISMRTGNPINTVAQKNEMPTVLLGSKTGTGAIIKLADDAAGFGNLAQPKAVLHYYQPEIVTDTAPNPDTATIEWGGDHAADREGNIMIDSLTVETGPNPAAIGLVMSSAQGGVLQDVTIKATGSLAGIVGGSGNGGSWTNVTVSGGKFGIDSRTRTVTVPSMQNITLENQTGAAWLAGAGGTTVVAGMKIIADYANPAIIRTSKGQPFFGSISLIDTQIEYKTSYSGNAIAGTTSSNNDIIDTDSIGNAGAANGLPSVTNLPSTTNPNYMEGLYLNQVYVKNAGKVVTNDVGTPLNANSSGWFHVEEYATGKVNEKWDSTRQFDWKSRVFLNKQESGSTYVGTTASGMEPPVDLQIRHGWTKGQFPNFETPGIADVKADYGAAGNGAVDDTNAIQAAIDANDYVFLPKGYYRITKTLKLKPATKLFGISPAFTYIYTKATDTTNPNWGAGPTPLVETSNTTDADTIISDITITPPREVSASASTSVHPLYSILWQSGGSSMMRAVQIEPTRTHGFAGSATPASYGMKAATFKHPFLLITGSGGGKIYNVYAQLFGATGATGGHDGGAGNGQLDEDNMSLLAIRDTSNPLSLYATNWEYIRSKKQVEVTRAKYVTFYGSKTEENTTYMHIKDSDHIRIFGHSGSGTAPYDSKMFYSKNIGFSKPTSIDDAKKGNLFLVENTPNFLITNMADQVTIDHGWILGNQVFRNPYDLYYPLKVDGQPVNSDTRPSLYKIGSPKGTPLVPIFTDSIEPDLKAGWTDIGTIPNTSNKFDGAAGLQFSAGDSIQRTVSTSGFKNIKISYARKTAATFAGTHQFKAQWSPNGGATWFDIEALSGPNNGNGPSGFMPYKKIYALPTTADNNSNFTIRFSVSNPGNNAYLDALKIEGEPANPIFEDKFTGSLPAPWEITGSTASSNTNLFDNQTGFSVKFSAGTPSSTLSRVVHTTGYKDITVSYARKTGANNDAADTFKAEYSTNNGSTWNPIETLTGVQTGKGNAGYMLPIHVFPIPPAGDNNSSFKIKFTFTADSADEFAYMDNVRVDGTPIIP
ncbi:hypothetical protein FE783_29645 [Paenibacillus mesophilus]|uniref:glycosyl hydrolase family 28-related protein n=1 Tax=Paenibacillus mesophilus TaxID=2582849 RepID=UPI00110F300B|nr:glycosyl hydrolase family 28-related protein [Paenibacillus mesophilus]TMV45260.1 hypothetical protein FE783_29645 [Paenibacillus mesophilus]